MAKRLAPQVRDLYASEIRAVAVDFSGVLDDGETLASVISVTDPTAELAVTSQQVSTTSLEINGKSVAAGNALQFVVDHNGASSGRRAINIECSTTAGQEITGSVVFNVYR